MKTFEKPDDERLCAPPRDRVRAGAVELRLMLLLGAFVVVGIPFVAILWETLNEVLSGHIDGGRLVVAVPVLAVFLAILTLAGRALGRLDRTS